MVDTINEDCNRELTVNFLNAAGVAETPSSVYYRVDCETTGRQVRDWTEFADTLASSIVIELTGIDVAILDAGNETETKKVQVVSESCHYEYEYIVTNLHHPITPEIVRGDDYGNSNGRALKWTGGEGWPVLTGASILLTAESESTETTLSVAGAIDVETGRRKTVRAVLTDDDTLALEAASNYLYKVVATLSGGDKQQLASGTMVVVER